MLISQKVIGRCVAQDVLRRDDRDLAILGATRKNGVADMALVPSF